MVTDLRGGIKPACIKPNAPDRTPTAKPAPGAKGAVNPPNTDISGLIRGASDLFDSAFKRGVKYGRYLEQQEHPPIEHGTWIAPAFMEQCGFNVFKCSKCGYVLWGKKTNFCPDCGKPMDKKINHET